MKKIVAVIVAAGEGVRMGDGPRKQYISLGNLPVLVHTLLVFDKNPEIDHIVLVLPESDLSFCRGKIIAPFHFNKKIQLVSGGASRQESVYNGLKAVEGDCDIVVIHDGVRPFVSDRLISESVRGAQKYGACIVAVPAKDTLKIVKNNAIQKTFPRDEVWLAQTPQAFRYNLIVKAHEKARIEQLKETDDAALVERLRGEVYLVQGELLNIKITTPEDLKIAEAILSISN
ncbi:MAG: 2-C-methyl-D-erythritol 4-phosphate cytidylyltransferase [Pseudomonadota bacterium]